MWAGSEFGLPGYVRVTIADEQLMRRVGAALARAEMVEGLGMLLDRVNNLRLDPDAEKPVFRFHYTRSFRPLHVLFDRVAE